MRRHRRRAAGLFVVLTALVLGATPAPAAEYRLQVASFHDDSVHAYLAPGELRDGASGPGIDRLEAALDRGEAPRGAMLFDRELEAMPETRARQWEAQPVRVEVQRGGSGSRRWDEVRWEGKPGERTVWVVARDARRPQEVQRVFLRGVRGPLRHWAPYAPERGRRFAVLRYPLPFLWASEERGDLWQKYAAPALDLTDGIGVVVGVNHDRFAADHVYLVVRHPEGPATFKAVIGWRQAEQDREAPSELSRRLRRW